MLEVGLGVKLDMLKGGLSGLGSVLVAFSGGVDSTFLLKVAHDVLGSGNVVGATGVSASYPASESEDARALAVEIGARHILFDSGELDVAGYRENPPNRCYFCKKELFGKLKSLAVSEGVAHVCEGSNTDDGSDYRPGMVAVREAGVLSPLADAGLSKSDIRELSRRMGLRTWEKPAFACLASRFPYGEVITEQKLGMVERAEQFVRNHVPGQCRVRYHGDVARIELPPASFPLALECAELISKEVKACGFKYVSMDLDGYRTGSMNETLAVRRTVIGGRINN